MELNTPIKLKWSDYSAESEFESQNNEYQVYDIYILFETKKRFE